MTGTEEGSAVDVAATTARAEGRKNASAMAAKTAEVGEGSVAEHLPFADRRCQEVPRLLPQRRRRAPRPLLALPQLPSALRKPTRPTLARTSCRPSLATARRRGAV